MSQDNSYKQGLSYRWIKAESGSTYLCPADALERISDRSDAELRRICVDESSNPHNE